MKKYRNILIISFIVLLLDQISKYIISSYISLNSSIKLIKNFFSLTYTKNFGAAWSIMWNERIILIIIASIALIFIIYLIYKEKDINKYKSIYYGFILGGLMGNLIDRIFLGYVIDFFDFNIFGYNFPIFNISDSFIVIGVIMVLIETLIGGKNGQVFD